jgi:endonuclease/exonuclease/phosphatase family metal-dependent hydrolase
VSKRSASFDLLLVEPAAIIMLAAELCEVVSPSTVSILSLTGLMFPFALLAFVIGVVLRLSRGYWKGLVLPALVVLITVSSITSTVGGWRKIAVLTGETVDDVSIMSFNVRRMDEYNWLKGDETRRELYSWLGKNKCDIMCFQEFPSNMKDKLQGVLDTYDITVHGKGSGPAVATILNVVNKEFWTFEDEASPRGLVLDMVKGGDTIRVVNVHLQSVGLARDDYQAVREGTDSEDRRRLLSRLKKAYSLRAAQSLSLRKYLDSSPHKILLAGDFNDTPVSYALNTIKNSDNDTYDLYDAFSVCGSGIGATYIGDLPGLRIDFLLFSEGLFPREFKTHGIMLSDHRPIYGVFEF